MTERGTYLRTWIAGRSWHRCDLWRKETDMALIGGHTVVAISSVLGLNKQKIWHCGEWKNLSSAPTQSNEMSLDVV